jgi:hypothetical protein
VAAFFTPPACREEVLGDLHERSRTAPEFCIEAVSAIPLVIFSRVRRTADPQFLPLYAAIPYLCFWAAAWFEQRSLAETDAGLLRLAVPAAIMLLAVLLEDAYAKPGKRFPMQLVRGPVYAASFVAMSQFVLRAFGAPITLPLAIVLYGTAMALFLTSALRLLFSSQSASPQGPQSL